MAKLKEVKPESKMHVNKRGVTMDRGVLTEEQKEKMELDEAQKRISEREQNRVDKVSRAIGGVDWIGDVSPSQVIPRKILDSIAVKDHSFLEKLPKIRFSRFYLGPKYIVDMFQTPKEYEAADVEGRRQFAKTLGKICGYEVKYGALGPQHRTVDLVEQLGL
jgi:hypothetical protein